MKDFNYFMCFDIPELENELTLLMVLHFFRSEVSGNCLYSSVSLVLVASGR
jgi:hypothetical protein